MKKQTKVVLHYNNYSLPENLGEYITTLQEYYDSIPEEYQKTARIETEKEYGYGDECYFVTTIYFNRPETAEEQKVRETKENKQKEAIKMQELAQLENLLKKYNK